MKNQDNRHSDQGDVGESIRPEALGRLHSSLSKIGSRAFREVILAYLRESQSRLEQMNQALSQSNMTELQLASHTLKSSSALVGAARLSGLCEQLEGQAREAVQHSLDILPNVYEKFSQIQAEYNRVEKALEIELSKQ